MERAKSIIAKYATQGKIGVAVSGGADSMTLLHLAMSLLRKENIVVLNVEHGLRGETSKADSQFVCDFASKNGLEFICRSVDVLSLVNASGRSEETEARLARHSFFAEVLSDGIVNKIMLAHNRGDNTESVFMHLMRGSGNKGLLGMQEEDGNYLRPLLSVSRDEIEKFVQSENIPFVTDESNYQTKYNRNFLRREVIPLMRARYDVDTAVETLSKNARTDEDFIRSCIDFDKYVVEEENCIKLDEKALKLHKALSSRLIFECASRLGRKCDVTAKHVLAVIGLADAENGKKVDLGQNLFASKEYGFITFFIEEEQVYGEEVEFFMGITPFANGMIEALSVESIPQKGKLIVDGDAIPDGSVVRFRREGDIFRPYGSGSKKLKEYLIDKKIPLRKRDCMPLLCNGEKVLAIFNLEISDELKITKSTRNALELKFTED